SISGLAPPLDSIVNIAANQIQAVLASTIADNIATALMQSEARTAVAASLRPKLNQLGVKQVRTARVAAGAIVIEHGAAAAPSSSAAPVCPAGQSNCNSTCIHTNADVRNCGGCGITCQPGQVCTVGRCQTTSCPAGQSICNGTCIRTDADIR